MLFYLFTTTLWDPDNFPSMLPIAAQKPATRASDDIMRKRNGCLPFPILKGTCVGNRPDYSICVVNKIKKI